MKTILLIVGLTLARVVPAQNSPPDTTVVKKQITEKQKENRHHGIHASAIVIIFVVYMWIFIRNENR